MRSAICRLCAVVAMGAAAFSFATSPLISARPAALHAQCGGWKVAPVANPASRNGGLNAVTAISIGDAWAVGSNQFGSVAIEHWNGRRWGVVPAPSPPESTLYSVSAISRTNIWAVGETNEDGNKVWSLIEHWNGKIWRRVPGPALPNAQLNSVFARTSRDVWAVGEKWIVQNSNSRGLIEHWNGHKWSVVKSPQTDKMTARQLESVTAVSAHAAWAVGSDDWNSPVIEYWNGRRWSAVPAGELPEQMELHAVAAKSPTDVWAVGQGGHYGRAVAEHWNGRLWTAHDTAFIRVGPTGYLSTELDSLAAGRGKQMWAVGSQSNEEGADQALIELWNGRHWKVLGRGMNRTSHGLYTDLYGVAASPSHASKVWAVGAVGEGPGGYLPGPGVDERTLTARWNGTSWKTVASPNPPAASSELLAVDAPSDSPAWAVGDTLVNGYAQALAERWTGSRWITVPTPRIPGRNAHLSSVEATGANDVWAVGSSEPPAFDAEDIDARSQRLIEHWNGSRWSIVPGVEALPRGEVFGVSADSSRDVWAVGWQGKWGWGHTTPLVERWNGSVWKRMPNPPGMDQITAQDQNGPLTYEIAALSPTDVWIASTFGALDYWNGMSWKRFSSPGGKEGHAYLSGLAASSSKDVWSAGYSYVDQDNPYLSLASRWNGTSWKEVHTIDPTSENNVFHAVADISRSNVWVIGYDDNGLLAEHFNGTGFRTVPMAASQAAIVGADGNASTVWTVGSSQVDRASAPVAERFVRCPESALRAGAR